jgi:hypothetical protein
MRLLITLLAAAISPLAMAQIGTNVCSCQPGTYTFTFDFSLICADRDIKAGDPGVIDAACVLNPQGIANVTDFVPVRVSEVQILELDQALQVISQTTYARDFLDRSSFTYSSITVTMPKELNSTSIPKGIQVYFTGQNAQGQDLVNFYAIVYDNSCGIFPVLQPGQVSGWTIFVSRKCCETMYIVLFCFSQKNSSILCSLHRAILERRLDHFARLRLLDRRVYLCKLLHQRLFLKRMPQPTL